MWKQTSGSLNQLPKPWFKDTSGPTSNLWVALKERKWARTRDLLGTLVECPTWKPRPFLSFSLSQEPYKRLTGSPVCSLPSPPVDCFQANYGRLARTRDSGTLTRLACTGDYKIGNGGHLTHLSSSTSWSLPRACGGSQRLRDKRWERKWGERRVEDRKWMSRCRNLQNEIIRVMSKDEM
jgi:hypothetical protein